jgi:hypothetical protein
MGSIWEWKMMKIEEEEAGDGWGPGDRDVAPSVSMRVRACLALELIDRLVVADGLP